MNALAKRNYKKWLRHLPSVKQMTKDALKGASRRHWYQEAHSLIQEHFPERDTREAFIKILASTSPRQTVRANWSMALDVYMSWIKNNLRPLPLKEVELLTDLHARALNTRRSMLGEDLSGLKVAAFAENLKGNLRPVVIDTWMLAYAGVANEQGLTKGTGHSAYVNRVAKVARRLGWQPAEVQASLWCYTYAKINKIALECVPSFKAGN